MATRRFVHSKQGLFWEIDDIDTTQTVVSCRGGKLGEAGQEETHQESDPNAVVKRYAGLVAANIGEGWDEVLAIDPRGQTEPTASEEPDPSAETHRKVQLWWDDDKTRLKKESFERLSDGKTDGNVRTWHKDGTPLSWAVYRGGFMHNILLCNDGKGQKLCYGDLKDGQGLSKGYYANGAIRYHGETVDGRSHGVWFYGHDNGRLSGIGLYHEGKRTGLWRHYHANGAVRLLEEYEGGVVCMSRFFYDDGTVQCHGPGQPDDKGNYQRAGQWHFYTTEGVLYETSDYTTPGQIGVESFDRQTGKLRTRGTYVKGYKYNRRHGVTKEFNDKGKVTKVIEYDMGAQVEVSNDGAKRVAKFYNKHSENAARIKAIKRAFNDNANEWLSAVLDALNQGLIDPDADFRSALYFGVYIQQATKAPGLWDGCPEADAVASLERVAKAQLGAQYPKGEQLLLVSMGVARVRPELLRQAPFDRALAEAASRIKDLYQRPAVEALRQALATVEEGQRQAAILHQSGPLWAYAGLCPTAEVIDACLQDVLKWKRNQFTYAAYRRDAALEAFEAWGAAATDPILAMLDEVAFKAPRRDFFALGLAIGAQPQAADALITFAGDSIEEVRQQAVAGLAMLAEQDMAVIEKCLKARKKNTRISGAQALARMPRTEQTAALATAWVDKLKDAEAREALAQVLDASSSQTPPGLAALNAAMGTWSDEEAEAWSARLERVRQWDRSGLVIEMAHKEPRVAFMAFEKVQEAEEGKWLIAASDMRGLFVHLHEVGNEAAPWMAAQVAHGASENRYNAARSLKDNEEVFGGVFCQALVHFMVQEPCPNQKHYIKWLAEHQPMAAAPVLMVALGDKSKPVRVQALAGLMKTDASIAPKLWPLLEGSTHQVSAVAQLLATFPQRESVEHLEAAIGKTRSANVKEDLRSAISACKLAFPDAAAGAEGAQGVEGAEGADGDALPAEQEVEDLDTKLQKLDAQLASRAKGRPPKLDPPPQLRWQNGAPVSDKARKWIMGALKKEDQNTQNAELRQVAAMLDTADRLGLSDAINTAFTANSKNKWVLYQRAVLGSDADMEFLGATLQQAVWSQSAAWAGHMVNVLVRMASPASVRWLDYWARHAETRKLKRDARASMMSMAAERQMGWDDLVDEATKDHGFGPDRQQVYRGQEVALAMDGTVSCADGSHAPSALVDGVKKARREIAGRFEVAMIAGRRWTLDLWQAHVQRPIVQTIVPSLLCMSLDIEGQPMALFAFNDALEPVDAEGKPVDLSKAAFVGVPHPVELSDADLATWTPIMGAKGQPFEQVQRAFSPDPQADIDALRTSTTIAPRKLLDRFSKEGYVPGGAEDAGMVYEASRQLTSRWAIVISHEGYYAGDGRHPDKAAIEVTGCHIRDSRPDSWENPPTKGALCEALVDLQKLLK